jgi:hypothetical protein
MAQDLWETSIVGLMRHVPQERAAHYRQQAMRLRELAEMETDQAVRADFRDLAEKYEALASSVAGQC